MSEQVSDNLESRLRHGGIAFINQQLKNGFDHIEHVRGTLDYKAR